MLLEQRRININFETLRIMWTSLSGSKNMTCVQEPRLLFKSTQGQARKTWVYEMRKEPINHPKFSEFGDEQKLNLVREKGGRGRCGGLMVGVQDSRSSGLDSSPGWSTALCSWVRHFSISVPRPLFTQVYKWVPANLIQGWPCNGLASHPGRSRNTAICFILRNLIYAQAWWATCLENI